MNKRVVEACFPLHEGRHDVNGPQGEKSDRRVSNRDMEIILVMYFKFLSLVVIHGVGSLEEFLQGSAAVAG